MEITAIVLGIVIGIICWLFNKYEDALQALGHCVLNSVIAGLLIYFLCLGGAWTVLTIAVIIYYVLQNMRYGNG